jgi:hypothetical protein
MIQQSASNLRTRASMRTYANVQACEHVQTSEHANTYEHPSMRTRTHANIRVYCKHMRTHANLCEHQSNMRTYANIRVYCKHTRTHASLCEHQSNMRTSEQSCASELALGQTGIVAPGKWDAVLARRRPATVVYEVSLSIWQMGRSPGQAVTSRRRL